MATNEKKDFGMPDEEHNVSAKIQYEEGRAMSLILQVNDLSGNPTPLVNTSFRINAPLADIANALANHIEAGILKPGDVLDILDMLADCHLAEASEHLLDAHQSRPDAELAYQHTADALKAQNMMMDIRASKSNVDVIATLEGSNRGIM